MARVRRARTEARNITLAFAGAGEVDAENVKALLNDLVGIDSEDADGYGILPEGTTVQAVIPVAGTVPEEMDPVFDWMAYASVDYVAYTDDPKTHSTALDEAAEVVKATNVLAATINHLTDAGGGEKYLILLRGEEGTAQTEILMDLASSDPEILIKDLTAGQDEIAFSDETPEADEAPESTPEPEPVEEAPAPRSKRAPVEELDQPEEELTEDDTPEPVPAPVEKADEAQTAIEGPHIITKTFPRGVEDEPAVDEPPNAPEETINPELVSAVAQEVVRILLAGAESYAGRVSEEKRGRGRPRKDGTPAQPRSEEEKSTVEIFNEETGEWEPKGRGRPRAGAITRRV